MKKLKYEPLRSTHFNVIFDEKYDINTLSVISCNLPVFKDNVWQNIKIEYQQMNDPNCSIGLRKLVDDWENNLSFFINLFNPARECVFQWEIQIKRIKEIHFGNLDFREQGFLMPYIIVEPLNCILHIPNND